MRDILLNSVKEPSSQLSNHKEKPTSIAEEPREIVTFLYRPHQRVFQLAFRGEIGLSPVGQIRKALSPLGIKFISSSMSSADGRVGTWCVFLSSDEHGITSRALRDRLGQLPALQDLRITTGEEFVVDQLFFPITDPLGNRLLIITQSAFQQMMRALGAMLGSGEGVVAYHEGYSMGATYASGLRGLLKGDPKKFASEVPKLYTAMGIGMCEFLEKDFDRMHFVIRFSRNIECEGERSDKPRSQWLRGMLIGGASAFLDTQMECKETKCISIGDPYCEFELFKSEGC